MNSFIATLLLIGGVFIRIGIPIVITIVLSTSLQKLDRKWKNEAELESIKQQAVEKQVLEFQATPCWVFNNCSQLKFQNCTMRIDSGKFCWEVKNINGKFIEECSLCEYRNYIENESTPKELMLIKEDYYE